MRIISDHHLEEEINILSCKDGWTIDKHSHIDLTDDKLLVRTDRICCTRRLPAGFRREPFDEFVSIGGRSGRGILATAIVVFLVAAAAGTTTPSAPTSITIASNTTTTTITITNTTSTKTTTATTTTTVAAPASTSTSAATPPSAFVAAAAATTYRGEYVNTILVLIVL
jgi:hypothetical protein